MQDLHVLHARESGRKAARVILGKPLTPYDPIPHQYSSVDEWGFAWRFWGVTSGEPIVIGNMTNDDGWYALWFDQGEKLCGAMHCAVDVEVRFLAGARGHVRVQELADEIFLFLIFNSCLVSLPSLDLKAKSSWMHVGGKCLTRHDVRAGC